MIAIIDTTNKGMLFQRNQLLLLICLSDILSIN